MRSRSGWRPGPGARRPSASVPGPRAFALSLLALASVSSASPPPRPFLAATPGPSDAVPGFWDSAIVRRDLARFETTCAPLMGAVLDDWLALYDANARVLTIEASCVRDGSFGLGNIVGDFQAWFVWGIVHRRAVYVRWTDCASEEDDAVIPHGLDEDAGGVRRCPAPSSTKKKPREVGSPPTIAPPAACRARANLGQYWTLPGGKQWMLTPDTWRAIAASIGRSENQTTGTGRPAARRVSAPDDFGEDPSALFGPGGVLAGADPWVRVDLVSGHALVPHPPADGSREARDAARAWSDALIGDGYRALANLTNTDVSRGDDSGDMSDFALVEGLWGVHLRGCLLHAMSRPSPRLQKALLPFARAFDADGGLSLAAVHVRTRFVDDVGDEGTEDETLARRRGGGGGGGGGTEAARAAYARADAAMRAAPGNFALAKIRHGPIEARWRELDRLLQAGGFERRNDDALVHARCPRIRGGEGPGDPSAPFAFGERDSAGLSPYVTCAGRAAELAASERGDATKWKLYVATDAPYLKHLASEHPSLRGKIVGCDAYEKYGAAAEGGGGEAGREKKNAPGNACVFRHTAHGVSHRESHDRFAQAFVDAWIVGAADQTLPVTPSTFTQLAHRGFGVNGRPQMMHRDRFGFEFQGGGEGWSNKHLPVCEALGMKDEGGGDGGVCVDVYSAVWGRGPSHRVGLAKRDDAP